MGIEHNQSKNGGEAITKQPFFDVPEKLQAENKW